MSSPGNVDLNGNNQREFHIIIIGAGITGLVFAQGLRKFNESPSAASHPVKYTCSVYERNHSVLYHGGGYSLSLHWCLPHLDETVPQDIIDSIPDSLCNPHSFETGDHGKIQYMNLRDGRPKVVVERRSIARLARVSREKMVKVLMRNIDVQFSKQLSDITWPTSDTVKAHFADGTSDVGHMLIGADGANSTVRRILCGPEAAANIPIPVRMMGLRCEYPVEKTAKVQAVDPNIIMGGDPELNTFYWFSFLHMPRPNSGIPDADCHMLISWPSEDPYAGGGKAPEIPAGNDERLALAKSLADGWAEPMRSMVHDIPSSTEMREINLVEWAPRKGLWDNHSGRVTMVGDAAHSMSPCEISLFSVLLSL